MTSLRHLRSSTANKRPDPAAMVDGQLAMNYDIASPGLFFKDDNGTLIKVGPVHIGTTAPNVSPAAGGTAGNSIGEQWLDTTSGVYVLKVWDGSAWRSESGTFVDVSGDTMTGALTMANQQAVRFSETTANGSNYIALQADAALASNKTITLPDTTGFVVTTGDTGTVTSTMIANDTILNADVNASAAIAGSKISPDFGSQTIVTTGIFSSAAGTAAAPSIAFTGDLNTGIYSPGADQLAVSTGGTGRLFVDASGRVGIGTSSPAYGLHLSGINATSSTAQIATTATSDATVRTTTSLGTFAFGTGIGSAAKCWNVYDVDNSAERLRIDSSGNVGIGTSSLQARFHVETNIASTTGQRVALFAGNAAGDTLYEAVGCVKFDNNTTTSQVFNKFYINAGSVGSGQINANGAGAAAFGSFSDIRLKENIANISPQLQNICSLRPVEFDYKNGSGHQIGFIAQEIEEIYPDTVAIGLDDMLTVTGWNKTEARLVKAFQEAIARIETLEAAVAALQGA